MKRQRNTTQMKGQTRNTEVQINEEEIGILHGKEFKIRIVKMIKNFESKMEKRQESINKDLEEWKNKHTETNTMTEIKNTREGINSRISEAEEWISELEDKMVEITSEKENKVKRMKRTEDSLRDLWENIKCTNIQIIGIPEEMAIGTYISIITLNVNGLNAPTKRHRLAEWIQKQDQYICCLQETHFRPKDTYGL